MATESGYTNGLGSSKAGMGDSNPNNDASKKYDVGALFGSPPAHFTIKNALTNIRQKIIDKFYDLKKDKFYDGVNLKVFMTEILQLANRNADRMKTQKQFDARIMYLVGDVMMKHKKIGGNDLDKLDARRMRNYYGEDYQQRIK